MKKTLSVIIPIYNTPTKYLIECLNSLSKVDSSCLEVILIDDGSTTDVKSACSKYLEDSRFQYFAKENGGVSSARNLGILKSTAEYIAFVDSDDFINPNVIEEFLDSNEMADLYIYNFINTNGDGKKKRANKVKKGMQPAVGVCWSKIFKASIIKENNITFNTNIKYGEDSIFLRKYRLFCKSEIVYKQYLYFYRINLQNTSHRYNPNAFHDFNNTLEEYKKIENNVSGIRCMWYFHYYILPIAYFHKECKLSKREKYAEIIRYLNDDSLLFKEGFKRIEKDKMGPREKIHYILLKRHWFHSMVLFDRIIFKVLKKSTVK